MKIVQRERSRPRRTLALPAVALAVATALFAGACGGSGGDEFTNSPDVTDGAERVVLREPAGEMGPDPFTTEMGDGDYAEEVAALPESERDPDEGTLLVGTEPGLYGGTGDASRCDPAALVTFFGDNPDKAQAWAGAIGIETDEIAEYVDALEPAVLLHDTRVTNNGFSNGRATPRQSVLQAGTAVLVDVTGVPRTRCACGNPLAPPEIEQGETMTGASWPDAETPHIVVPGPVQPIPEISLDTSDPSEPADSPEGFCQVWAEVEPTISGGPAGPDDIDAYIARMQDGFTRLVEAAEQTEGFPPDALADLRTYRDDLLAWSGTGSPGSEELRDRIEAFLPSYCSDPPVDGHEEPTDPDPDFDPTDPVAGTNCGSMTFYLLIYTAESLGVDHAAVSQPYLDALNDLYAGIDPGSEWDLGSLEPMLAVEEVGCQGAQAVYDLLVDAGFGDLLAGTDLEP